MIKRDFLN